jgi:hypothetical protein
MKMRDFLEKWGLAQLKLSVGFLEAEFKPADPDRMAAWDLYVELLTRVTTQHLLPDSGDEVAALDSVHEIFPLTREILRKHGSGAGAFARIAIPVLNQAVRPFTSKWHRLAQSGALRDAQGRQFREELGQLQEVLRHYTRALADMACVEDLTQLEDAA